MKNINPEATEFYSKMVKEKKYIDMEFTDRRADTKGNLGVEDRYKVEKEQAVKHEEVIAMNDGEMIVFNDGKAYRAISTTETSLEVGKKISYKIKENTPIPITEYMPKKMFLKEVYKAYKKIEKEVV